jgi:predicted DsbA family dithiol-disulfide isomerase
VISPPPSVVAAGRLTVDVHFDLICPWCLIGRRHLETARQQFAKQRPDVAIEVAWRSHVLLPDTPREGLPYQAFYERRLGGPAAVAARREQVREAGRAAGVDFAFERIAVLPDTRPAHRLIAAARTHAGAAGADALVERLFGAYFIEGRDIGDAGQLAAIALGAGLPADTMSLALAAVQSREHGAPGTDRHVPGVPFFVIDERIAISGAQPPAVLLDALLRSARQATTVA